MENRRITTKSEMAYYAIKEAIFNTEFKPGERIVIRKVAEQIGTSDIPVREALNKLESENLVEIEPHVGFRVKKVSDRNTFEKLEVKYELEAVAIRKTAENILDSEIQEAEKKLKALEKLGGKKNYIEYFAGIREFNLMLYKAGRNETLYELLVPLFQSTNVLGTIYILVPGWCKHSVEKHREILEAVKARDGDKAYELMRQFKFEGLRRALEKMSENGIVENMEQEWADQRSKYIVGIDVRA